MLMETKGPLYVDGKLNPEWDVPIIYWCKCPQDKGHNAGTLLNNDGSLGADLITCIRCGGVVMINGKKEHEIVGEWDGKEN